MARPEYPTSIRLTVVDKRRLRKQAEKSKRSLAGLIQMILLQWLSYQEGKVDPAFAAENSRDGAAEAKAQEKKDVVVEQPRVDAADHGASGRLDEGDQASAGETQ